MIYFSDRTINECEGHYPSIVALMRDDENLFDWMLKSSATVVPTDLLGQMGASFDYQLHFWSNGNVVIMNTNHPVVVDVPDDDLRELRKWCDDHGWKKLKVHHLLTEDSQGFQFWMRMYIAGLVFSEVLVKHEEADMERLLKAAQSEEDEDADQSSFHV